VAVGSSSATGASRYCGKPTEADNQARVHRRREEDESLSPEEGESHSPEEGESPSPEEGEGPVCEEDKQTRSEEAQPRQARAKKEMTREP
jgi:hypothetical protein